MASPKNVLVTGGTRGLGLSVVRRLADEGYAVIATGRTLSAPLTQLIESQAFEHPIVFEQLDLAVPDSIRHRIGNMIDQHGELYGLVNNAAVGLDGVLATMHESDIQDTLQINLTSTILVTKYASRSMLIQRRGRIVNVASVVARTGYSGLAVYAATKAGLIGFTKSLSRELGKVGITVNSVSPGFLETEMTETLGQESLAKIKSRSALKKLASIDDVAGGIAYLMSDAGVSVTGTDLVIDAGGTA
ncbi:SDR family NAD(P)-dependent oxidoreductase [Roseiconus lacunae]|uniref:SDR family NAD(P)-dependent oxidoreductase n=1 Tax=Roseiconus lacunae TaxID=2605694 RepID=UPI001E31FD5C|nr:SDR family NAD(P)-dependent oxidoreductase [Roseiconus lacunae]MCD0459853.1 SDR family oxidoreductase [Roseiconus lacunae]